MPRVSRQLLVESDAAALPSEAGAVGPQPKAGLIRVLGQALLGENLSCDHPAGGIPTLRVAICRWKASMFRRGAYPS